MAQAAVRVLFVCLGNICRSPTAQGVFEARVIDAGWQDRIHIDSAGTGAWHEGEPPDARATAAARQRGYDLSPQRARQITAGDFARFDYVLAMDEDNLANLRAIAPANYPGHLGLFLDFDSASPVCEVPDPYYGGDAGFERVLDLIEGASAGLLTAIQRQ
ncbi:MAG: low molecular weight protein-tyrosine-phosphatase [Pseudomonadota bacterium]